MEKKSVQRIPARYGYGLVLICLITSCATQQKQEAKEIPIRYQQALEKQRQVEENAKKAVANQKLDQKKSKDIAAIGTTGLYSSKKSHSVAEEVARNSWGKVAVSGRHRSKYVANKSETIAPTNLYSLEVGTTFKKITALGLFYGRHTPGQGQLATDHPVYRPTMALSYSLVALKGVALGMNAELYARVPDAVGAAIYYTDLNLSKEVSSGWGVVVFSNYTVLGVTSPTETGFTAADGEAFTALTNQGIVDNTVKTSLTPGSQKKMKLETLARVIRQNNRKFNREEDGAVAPGTGVASQWVSSYLGVGCSYQFNDKLSVKDELRYYRRDAFTVQVADGTRFSNYLTLSYKMF